MQLLQGVFTVVVREFPAFRLQRGADILPAFRVSSGMTISVAYPFLHQGISIKPSFRAQVGGMNVFDVLGMLEQGFHVTGFVNFINQALHDQSFFHGAIIIGCSIQAAADQRYAGTMYKKDSDWGVTKS